MAIMGRNSPTLFWSQGLSLPSTPTVIPANLGGWKAPAPTSYYGYAATTTGDSGGGVVTPMTTPPPGMGGGTMPPPPMQQPPGRQGQPPTNTDAQDFFRNRHEYRDDDDPVRVYRVNITYYFDPDDRVYFYLDTRRKIRFIVRNFIPVEFITLPSVTNITNITYQQPPAAVAPQSGVQSIGDLFKGNNLILIVLGMGFFLTVVALGSRGR
jgi:hypothetical protein